MLYNLSMKGLQFASAHYWCYTQHATAVVPHVLLWPLSVWLLKISDVKGNCDCYRSWIGFVCAYNHITACPSNSFVVRSRPLPIALIALKGNLAFSRICHLGTFTKTHANCCAVRHECVLVYVNGTVVSRLPSCGLLVTKATTKGVNFRRDNRTIKRLVMIPPPAADRPRQ